MVAADWTILACVQVGPPSQCMLGPQLAPKLQGIGDPTCTQASVDQSAVTISGCGQQLFFKIILHFYQSFMLVEPGWVWDEFLC